jgi:aminopeptidase C
MDTSLFDYASYFGADAVPKMCKKDRLLYGQSLMTHAMVFTGYDVDPAVAEGVVEKRRAADEKEAAKVKAAAAAAAASDSSGGADDGDAAAAASVDELLPVSALRKWRVENSWGSENAPE